MGPEEPPLQLASRWARRIPQYEVSAVVATRRYDCYYTLFGDGEKMMTMGSSFNSIDSNTYRPICAVFEANWEG